ncbi:MAG: cytochrome c-type biogenesis protein CcmH [Gammaproteobacteria bacterium]|nr:cytochrome c-type biogenesis protein CcmH [Gammaproteobacteria bacterium]
MIVRCLGALVLLAGSAVWAATPVDVYQFPDADTEARYRGLIAEFRCPLCLNTNLAGSDAPIAQDLRRTVHRLLVQDGASDAAVRDFLQERYGDFVLYDPPLRWDTALLWLGPALFLALGVWALLRVLRQPALPPLEPEQRDELQRLLDEP